MSLASWAVLRQIEAVRVATATALQFGAIAKGMRAVSVEECREWLTEQGMDCPNDFAIGVLPALLWKQLQHPRHGEILRRCQAGASESDFGRQRSGAEFHKQTDFVLTSGFVRILGAHEQFERDVLKALLYYRPVGRSGPSTEYVDEKIGEDVILEQPQRNGDKLEYSKPAIWTWLSRQTENNIERRRFFANVFDISTLPDKAANKVHDGYYEMRNAVVHGREGIRMSLSQYFDTETHLTEAVFHLIEECAEKYRLHV